MDIFSLLKDKEKAILYAISRFDEEVKDSFLSLYKKIDETIIDPNHQPIQKYNFENISEVVDRVIELNHSKLGELVFVKGVNNEFNNWLSDFPEIHEADIQWKSKELSAEDIEFYENWIAEKFEEFILKEKSNAYKKGMNF